MIRNSKVLGLGLIVALALSAVVASAASASQYTASAYPATATGSNSAGNETLTTPGGTVQCDSHFQGSLSGASSTVAITPKYTNCVAFGFLNATVNMNGCYFILHATAHLGGGVYLAHLDIVCPPGTFIVIISGTCEVGIPAQTTLSSVKTTNLAGGTVTVQPNITNITMNVKKDGFGCPFSGTGHTTGSYHGDVVLSRVGGGSISVSGS
jgi:hypothetical protein